LLVLGGKLSEKRKKGTATLEKEVKTPCMRDLEEKF